MLKGWDSQALRPWIMVVEATIPLSSEINFASWEPILIAANYQFIYFDGLNRFYVAKEHIELAEAFSCPPNVFDNVILSANSDLCRGVIEQLQQAKAQAQQAKAQAQQAKAQAQQMHDQLIAIHQSLSWYITKPLRAVTRFLGGDFLPIRQVIQALKLKVNKILRPPLDALIKLFFDHEKIINQFCAMYHYFTKPLHVVKRVLGGDLLPLRQVIESVKLKVKTILRPPLATLIKYFIDHEKIHASLSPWIKRIPWVHQRLLRVGVNIGVVPPQAHNLVASSRTNQRQEAAFPEKFTNLTPRARLIYRDLKEAVDYRNKENG